MTLNVSSFYVVEAVDQKGVGLWAAWPANTVGDPTKWLGLKVSGTYGHLFSRPEDDVVLFEKMERDLMDLPKAA